MLTLEVREYALRVGFNPGTADGLEFGEIQKRDIARWAPIIKASGFKPAG